jgi:hypothetical protein
MGQEEDTETEISFEDLKTIVDAAIKGQYISAIEAIKDENHLRYMQKYAEMLLSKDEFGIGTLGIGIAIMAIGLIYIPDATADAINKLGGWILVILGFVIIFWEKTPLAKKNEFKHKIILKIEEKLQVKDDERTPKLVV